MTAPQADGLSRVDVYVARNLAALPGKLDIWPCPDCSAGCFDLYRIEWRETRLLVDGPRIVYRFRARDAESVRIALRNNQVDYDSLWVGAAVMADAGGENARECI